MSLFKGEEGSCLSRGVIPLYTAHEVAHHLQNLPQGGVIFLDVDDTLITPQSKIFRASSPYRFIIDDLKKHHGNNKNFEEILSHWRLNRVSLLVDPYWPLLIEALKSKYTVYGLTKIDTGAIGSIPSMEAWRYQELSQKGLSFSDTYENTSEMTLLTAPDKSSSARFYKGIFMTGAYKKGEVVRPVLQTLQPSQVIFVDDREEYLQEVKEECERQHIPFLGLLFKGVEGISGEPIPQVAEFQKYQLLKKSRWLEDEEAEKAVDQMIRAQKIREKIPSLTEGAFRSFLEKEKEAEDFGFCWETVDQILDQVKSEAEEVREAHQEGDLVHLQEELGDLLSAALEACLFCGFDPEETLEKIIQKLRHRFQVMKELVHAQGMDSLKNETGKVALSYWNQAKENLKK